MWASLSHENLLPLFTSSHTPYADFFVTLYCPAGSLFDILKRDGRPALPQDEVGRMYRQVVKGLRYMHEVAGFVHRDLKLENVLVDDMGVCRIGDFGMAKRLGDCDDHPLDEDDSQPTRAERAQTIVHSKSVREKRSRSRHGLSLPHHRSGPRHRNSSPLPASTDKPFRLPGSLPYAAPELLLPSSSRRAADPAQDIWALGVMLYALLTGRMPFADAFEPRLQMKILAGKWQVAPHRVGSCIYHPQGVFDMPTGIGKGAERILQGCLERSVQDRWTIDMVDGVACGIGCCDDDTEVPLPADMLPPARSRSQSRPASIPEHAIMDDGELTQSPVMDRSTSRTRSGRSRSRAFHPYQHDQHFPAQHQELSEPSLSGLHSSIYNWPGSMCFSPVASSSGNRGSGDREKMPSLSRSRSPSEPPRTPVDIAAVLAQRGRKVSRATAFQGAAEPRRIQFADETIPPSDDRFISADNDTVSPRVTRSTTRDTRLQVQPGMRQPVFDLSVPSQTARAESVPPHSLCSLPWSAQSFQVGRKSHTAASTPGGAQGKTPAFRSRSVCRS